MIEWVAQQSDYQTQVTFLASSSGIRISCIFSPGLIPIVFHLALGATTFAMSATSAAQWDFRDK